jgi:hypothetical protein
MTDRFFLLLAFILFAPIAAIQTNGQQPSLYKVEDMSFNTPGFSEISPVIVKDGIVFCSDRRFSIIKDRTSFDGRRLYNIYLSRMLDSARWGKPEELKGERNSLFNNGPFCIGPDGRTIYFTSEVATGPETRYRSFRNHSGIFIAELSGNQIINLRPFLYNSSDYDVAQPSVSSDGKYLCFASNMPGGLGGSDLYYCENVDGEWSTPVNFGPAVNTPSSENYPYYHPSGRLYFTSDRSGGPGKLDVYFTNYIDGAWDIPILLPEPINSPADDFGLVARNDLQEGYFVSNRNKSDDIYRFESSVIRKASCGEMEDNSFCYRFVEENAVKLDSTPFRYDWSFGDGQKASGIIVEHCYDQPGIYVVQLDVVNLITKEVSVNEKSDTLVVTQIEQAYFTCPDSVATGQKMTLSADETYLPGWKITRYYWNFGDETVAIGNRTDKTFRKPGVYNVQLIVSGVPDTDGQPKEACVSKNIIVYNSP